MLILGKPGAGKSTFVNYLAINACEEHTNANLIPVLIRLIDIDTRQSFRLMKLIETAFDTDQTTTEKILKSGSLFLIIDGLDEVPSQFRQDVCQEVSNFIQSPYKNKVIITCRTEVKDYKVPSLFKSVEIADFNREQQQQFIENWFSLLSQEPTSWLAARIQQNSRCNSQELNQYLLNHQPIQELAKTPILLSLICLVYVTDGCLPEKRSALYERGLDILLEQWDEYRGIENRVEGCIYKGLNLEAKREILQELALHTFERSENSSEIEQTEVLNVIAQHLNDSHQGLNLSGQDAFQILDGIAADHGLLFQSARKKWSFSHLTFQEYFVAQWFVQHQVWERLCQHICEQRWREVFLLMTEIIEVADDFIELSKQKIDELLAKDNKLQEFLSWVDQKTRSVNAPYKISAIRAFYIDLEIGLSFDHNLGCAIDHNLSEVLNINFDNYIEINDDDDPFFVDNTDLIILHESYDRLSSYISIDLALHVTLQSKDRWHLDAAFGAAIAIAGNIDDSNLKTEIENLYNELPEVSCDNWKLENEWWDSKGKLWVEQLRTLIIHSRNIGHEWQFTKEQEQKLQQYYDANKLLVDCLKSGNVSDFLRQEIEDSLLLPITRTSTSGS